MQAHPEYITIVKTINANRGRGEAAGPSLPSRYWPVIEMICDVEPVVYDKPAGCWRWGPPCFTEDFAHLHLA